MTRPGLKGFGNRGRTATNKYEEPHANMIMIRGEKNSVTQRELLSSKEKKQGLDIGLPKHCYPSSKPA